MADDLIDFSSLDMGDFAIGNDLLVTGQILTDAENIIYQAKIGLSRSKSGSQDLLQLADGQDQDMDINAKMYLVLLDRGYTHKEICNALKIPSVYPVSWRSVDKVFATALDMIKDSLADQLESVSMQEAMTNPKANIERMFLIKGRKSEYRENAPLPPPVSVNLRISIDSKDFDVSANFRKIEDDDND